MNRLGILMLLLVLWAAPVLPQITRDAVPGGIVEIPLGPADQARPEAMFGQKRILVRQSSTGWAGLVGLPLDLVPGRYVVRTRSVGEEPFATRPFTVYPRRKSQVSVIQLPGTPPGQRTGLEMSWRDTLEASLPLTPPVDLPAKPVFGRYYGGSSPDTTLVDYVVFEIQSDVVVSSPGQGRATATGAGDHGLYVWIDHGMGLYSRLGPVTRLVTAGPGQSVKANQPLGRIILNAEGDPQLLYWSVYLNDTPVNPFLISGLDNATGARLPDAARN